MTAARRRSSGARLTPRARAWIRAGVGLGLLAALALQVGAEPFLAGLAAVSVPSVSAAMVLGAAATAAAAWRWRVVAGRLGLHLGWSRAIAAYYRSQFLNSVLPGGVIGDVHRAVWHGRDGDLAPAMRAVAAERAAGQAVQLVLAVIVLVALPAWIDTSMVGIGMLVVVLIFALALVAAGVSVRARRALRYELAQLAVMFGSLSTVLRVTAASIVVVVCHVATFAVACAAVGVAASPATVVAVSLIAVLAAGIPLGIGGWGPREVGAGVAFAAAGLGSAAGIAASTTFGVLALIAVSPGAVVVSVSAVRRRATQRSDRGATTR